MLTPASPAQFNFNTLLGTIALGVIAWVGTSVSSTKDEVTKLTTQLPFIVSSVDEVKGQIKQMVTHSELEAKFSESGSRDSVMEAKIISVESRMREVETKNK